MIKEHDRIVLTEPVPAEGLEMGDVGTVVHVYADGKAFEIEFTTLDGRTDLQNRRESSVASLQSSRSALRCRCLDRTDVVRPTRLSARRGRSIAPPGREGARC